MPQYLYNQLGIVSELYPAKKAVVTFVHKGSEQRGLLWGPKFICNNGQPLPDAVPINTVLSVGDRVEFDCHVYDNVNNQDNCQWYVARASRADVDLSQQQLVVNNNGRIEELTPRRGYVEFHVSGQPQVQRAVFLSTKLYKFEKRIPAEDSLFKHLDEGQPVQLDVVPGDGRLEGAEWYAPLVWCGKKPQVTLDTRIPDELLLDDDDEHRRCGMLTDALGPALSAADNRAAPIRRDPEKRGRVLSILDAERGLLLWQVRPRKYESVLFHRSVAHLFDLNLKNYDLRTVFKKGDHLRFEAEPSEHPGIYRWKAYSVWVES